MKVAYLLLIFVVKMVFDILFDNFGEKTTNWLVSYQAIHNSFIGAIFVFGVIYIKVAIAEGLEISKRVIMHSHFITWLMKANYILFFAFAAIELTYIGTSLEFYRKGMHQGDFALSQMFIMGLAIIFYILRKTIKKTKHAPITEHTDRIDS